MVKRGSLIFLLFMVGVALGMIAMGVVSWFLSGPWPVFAV